MRQTAMRTVTYGALAVSMATSAVSATAQAQTFEGAITLRTSGRTARGPMSQDMEYLVRGGKVRVNLTGPGGNTAMIMSPQEKKIFLLLPMQNAYTEMVMADSAVGRPIGAANDVKLTRTGRKEVVAGLTCEHVQVVSATGTADLCLTKELGRFMNPTDVMRGGLSPWQREIGNEFPLKASSPDGATMLEVIRVERKRLANDLFTVPGTYTKMTLPAARPRG